MAKKKKVGSVEKNEERVSWGTDYAHAIAWIVFCIVAIGVVLSGMLYLEHYNRAWEADDNTKLTPFGQCIQECQVNGNDGELCIETCQPYVEKATGISTRQSLPVQLPLVISGGGDGGSYFFRAAPTTSGQGEQQAVVTDQQREQAKSSGDNSDGDNFMTAVLIIIGLIAAFFMIVGIVVVFDPNRDDNFNQRKKSKATKKKGKKE